MMDNNIEITEKCLDELL